MNCARFADLTVGPTVMTSGTRPTSAMGWKSCSRWNGALAVNSTLLMEWLVSAPISRVCPSGGSFATALAPRLPAAPGRFSTTTRWPRSRVHCWASTRPTTSAAAPGGGEGGGEGGGGGGGGVGDEQCAGPLRVVLGRRGGGPERRGQGQR